MMASLATYPFTALGCGHQEYIPSPSSTRRTLKPGIAFIGLKRNFL